MGAGCLVDLEVIERYRGRPGGCMPMNTMQASADVARVEGAPYFRRAGVPLRNTDACLHAGVEVAR